MDGTPVLEDTVATGYFLRWEVGGHLVIASHLYWLDQGNAWSPYDELALANDDSDFDCWPMWALVDRVFHNKDNPNFRNLSFLPLLSALEPVVRGRFRAFEYPPSPGEGVLPEAADFGYAARKNGNMLTLFWSPCPDRNHPDWLIAAQFIHALTLEGKQWNLTWNREESIFEKIIRGNFRLCHPDGYLSTKEDLLTVN